MPPPVGTVSSKHTVKYQVDHSLIKICHLFDYKYELLLPLVTCDLTVSDGEKY